MIYRQVIGNTTTTRIQQHICKVENRTENLFRESSHFTKLLHCMPQEIYPKTFISTRSLLRLIVWEKSAHLIFTVKMCNKCFCIYSIYIYYLLHWNWKRWAFVQLKLGSCKRKRVLHTSMQIADMYVSTSTHSI